MTAPSFFPDLTGPTAFVESIMSDQCRIVRTGGEAGPVLDEDTGRLIATEATTIYDGKCYLSRATIQASYLDYGDAPQVAGVQSLAIPVTGDGYVDQDVLPEPGDTVIWSGPARDPEAVQSTWTVIGVDQKTFMVNRRLRLERYEGRPARVVGTP